jgi:hypothetical protein
MKFAVYILKASIMVLLVFLGLYVSFFCMDNGELDPIEVEMLGFLVFAALGILISWLLTHKAGRISPIIFWIAFILYISTFTLPALVTSVIIILYMTAG